MESRKHLCGHYGVWIDLLGNFAYYFCPHCHVEFSVPRGKCESCSE